MGIYVGKNLPTFFLGMNIKSEDRSQILENRIVDQQEVTNVDKRIWLEGI